MATALLRTCDLPSLPPQLRPPLPLRRLSRTGLRSRSNRPATVAMSAAEADGWLRKGISGFYDESSGLWESIWGDHMHHGYYGLGEQSDLSNHRSAQIRMVEEALRFAGVESGVGLQHLFRGYKSKHNFSGSRIILFASFVPAPMDTALRAYGYYPFLSMHEAPYGTVHWPMVVEGAVRRKARPNEESQGKHVAGGMWEDMLGDHMHHGFYKPGSAPLATDHPAAQLRMIEEALKFAGVSDDPSKMPKKIVDVGCGIGGSSRYLAKKYGANCCGITLSPVQAQRAQDLAIAEGLGDRVSFQVADALAQPFPDGQFHLVWSMESGEHMPNKKKFVSELARVAAPGATIIIVTWCHRDLSPDEKSLKPKEKSLLNKIRSAYYLPEWCSAADYVEIAQSLKLQHIRTADWSENVAPFWPAVIRSALTWGGFTSLIRSGWKTVRGALAMPLMIEGYNKNLIKFAIITCRKPE